MQAYAVAALRIFLWWNAVPFVVGIVTGFAATRGVDTSAHVSSPALGFVLTEFSVVLAGVAVLRSVSHTHRRPVRFLLSADGTFQPGRLLLGAAAWLSPTGALLGISIQLGGHVQIFWPVVDWPLWTMALVLLPFQAAAEEVLFRGYLTQSLGLVVRNRMLLVFLISLLFALAHAGSTPWWALPAQFAFGVAASAVVLRDGRLEAAIGAHAANNLLALLLNGPAHFSSPFTHGGATTALHVTAAALLVVAALKGAAFYGLTGAAASRLRPRAPRPVSP